jgi:hypothetical protein
LAQAAQNSDLSQQEQVPEGRFAVDMVAATKELNGRHYATFIKLHLLSLFHPGLTLLENSHVWNVCDNTMNRTRRDLVHSLFGLLWAPFFTTRRLHRPEFRPNLREDWAIRFLNSVCLMANAYLKDPSLADLLGNSIGVLTILVPTEHGKAIFEGCELTTLLNAFSLGPKEPPLFELSRAISTEALSLLFASAWFRPDFVSRIGTDGYLPTFIFNLVHVAQWTFERVGFCFHHSIIISTLLLMLADPVAAAVLNSQYEGQLRSSYQPQSSSLGDLLVNVLLNICKSQPFWPSFVNVFHMISGHVSTFSVETATQTMVFLQTIFESEKALRLLVLESIASMIQAPERLQNGFLIGIVQQSDWFRKIEVSDSKCSKALSIILKFLYAASQAQASSSDLPEIFANISISSAERRIFAIHPYQFEGAMVENWKDWIDLLFVRSFPQEVKLMKEYQEEFEPILVEALLAAKAAK